MMRCGGASSVWGLGLFFCFDWWKAEHTKQLLKASSQVTVVRGRHKEVSGKITQVYRRKWCIHLERLTKDKANGLSVNIPIDPSKVVVTKLKIDKDRKRILARKDRSADKEKNKVRVFSGEVSYLTLQLRLPLTRSLSLSLQSYARSQGKYTEGQTA